VILTYVLDRSLIEPHQGPAHHSQRVQFFAPATAAAAVPSPLVSKLSAVSRKQCLESECLGSQFIRTVGWIPSPVLRSRYSTIPAQPFQFPARRLSSIMN
ncbi:unnamed protein product, partial [Mycena citricolor]